MSVTNNLLHTAYTRERKPTQLVITLYLSSLLLLIAITISSCSKMANVSEPPQFLFGTTYGNCSGNCDTYFAINENKLYSTSGKYLPGPLVINYGNSLSDEKYKLARDLMNTLPELLLIQSMDSQTFGCPDCYDQGGIHIEYLNGQNIIKWHIDTDTSALTSPELKAYVVKTMNVIRQLKQ